MTDKQREVLLQHIGTGKTIVEVGCYLGDTTKAIAQQGNKVIAIDPFIGGYDVKDTISKWLSEPKGHDKILNTFLSNIRGLNVIFYNGTSKDALEDYDDGEVDGFFIDGEHTYKAMLIDVKWINKVKKGGLLCFHDYSPTFPGVMKAIDEFVIPYYKLIAQETSLVIFEK